MISSLFNSSFKTKTITIFQIYIEVYVENNEFSFLNKTKAQIQINKIQV